MNAANSAGKGLIDLLSEKHLELRKRLHEANGQPVNKSEAHILALLKERGRLSISEISRLIGISRQGTHKTVQGLVAAGLVEGVQVPGHIRDKHMALTPAGYACREQLEQTTRELEEQITAKLGQAQVEQLKRLLQEDWLEESKGR